LSPFAPTPSKKKTADGRRLLAAGIAALFVCVTFVQAYWKLLWGDEFVTLWIGQQRSFAGIWRALVAGADPNPPLMHVLDWWSTAVLGTGEVAVRLPSIVAMGLGVACLWVFLRRRVAPVYAAAGCLTLMATRGFDYAYDARSYALLMGFAMAAVLLWALSVEAQGWRRVLCLIGLCLALAAGISSNYYGVLAFFSVAGGEIAHGFAAKKRRFGGWIAMFVASLPLLGYLRLIRGNIVEFGPHAWNKPQLSMVTDSYLVIVEGILWPVVGFAVFELWQVRPGRRIQRPRSAFPVWERVAMWMFISYPVIAFLIAVGGAGMVSPRCAAPVCFGVAIFGTMLLARYATRLVAARVVAVLVVWVLVREAACGYVLLHQRNAFLHLVTTVEQTAAPDEAVVVGDSLVVMPLYWYGSAELRRGIVFPVDFDAIHRSEADDSGERNLWGGRDEVFPVEIDAPDEVLREDGEEIVIAPQDGWLARTMRARGDELRESPEPVRWDRLGGVFTPLAHEETRMQLATPKTTKGPR
jgi:Dolichyl-phosphate-mannose-protein mannosyltransferase